MRTVKRRIKFANIILILGGIQTEDLDRFNAVRGRDRPRSINDSRI